MDCKFNNLECENGGDICVESDNSSNRDGKNSSISESESDDDEYFRTGKLLNFFLFNEFFKPLNHTFNYLISQLFPLKIPVTMIQMQMRQNVVMPIRCYILLTLVRRGCYRISF